MKKERGISDHLVRGSSRKDISENIATERRDGKDPKQAVAIAYSEAHESKEKK